MINYNWEDDDIYEITRILRDLKNEDQEVRRLAYKEMRNYKTVLKKNDIDLAELIVRCYEH